MIYQSGDLPLAVQDLFQTTSNWLYVFFAFSFYTLFAFIHRRKTVLFWKDTDIRLQK